MERPANGWSLQPRRLSRRFGRQLPHAASRTGRPLSANRSCWPTPQHNRLLDGATRSETRRPPSKRLDAGCWFVSAKQVDPIKLGDFRTLWRAGQGRALVPAVKSSRGTLRPIQPSQPLMGESRLSGAISVCLPPRRSLLNDEQPVSSAGNFWDSWNQR